MIRRIWTLGVLLALLACAPALGAPVTVNLRIEGETGTFYEGPLQTDAKAVTTPSGGTHNCDGTNGGANPAPGPAITTALDDASAAAGFDWDGRYGVGGFDDFLIERIGSDGQVGVFAGKFWALALNRFSPTTGGCQTRTGPGDTVVIGWTAGEPNLELTAPGRAALGRPFAATVARYGMDGVLSPAPGAEVAGAVTGADGRATLTFADEGLKRFKATLPGAVRSNAAAVCVSADGTGDCGVDPALLGTVSSGGARRDTRSPVARLTSVRPGRRYRRGPRLLAGRVEEETALQNVYLRLRRTTPAGCRWYNAKRERWTRPRSCKSARFFAIGAEPQWSYLLPERLPGGSRYVLEVKALDRALHAGRHLVRFSVGRP